MKKIVSFAARAVFATMLLAAAGMAAANTTGGGVTADEALLRLKTGNAEFVADDHTHLLHNSTPAVRDEVALGQHPYAIVLDCADSRLSPEIIFNKGLGELFVVRVAGNILAPHQLGSIDYAVEHLGAKLIVVLGHSKCGAVNATVGALRADGSCIVDATNDNIGSLVDAISPAVEKVCRSNGGTATLEQSIDENVLHVAHKLFKKSPLVTEQVHLGNVKVIEARYDLHDGIVKWLGEAHPKK